MMTEELRCSVIPEDLLGQGNDAPSVLAAYMITVMLPKSFRADVSSRMARLALGQRYLVLPEI
jgi:hypothetical protein